MGTQFSNELQWFDFKIGHQDNSPNNGHQDDMPPKNHIIFALTHWYVICPLWCLKGIYTVDISIFDSKIYNGNFNNGIRYERNASSGMKEMHESISINYIMILSHDSLFPMLRWKVQCIMVVCLVNGLSVYSLNRTIYFALMWSCTNTQMVLLIFIPFDSIKVLFLYTELCEVLSQSCYLSLWKTHQVHWTDRHMDWIRVSYTPL